MSHQQLKIQSQKLWQLLLGGVNRWKCILRLLPDISESANAAATQVWSCYIGVVHTVYGIVKCLSLEQPIYITALVPNFQNKNTRTKNKPNTSLKYKYCI